MLDPIGRQEVLETIVKLNREQGTTVVLITHHMDEAAQADRLIVMNDGSVIADGHPKTVFQQVEELKGVGLTVPDTIALLYQLRQAGVDVAPGRPVGGGVRRGHRPGHSSQYNL